MPDPSDGAAMGAWLRKIIGNVPELATADAEQAIRTIRKRASEWGVDPDRVGILGYSAGGSVATGAAATTDPSARPSFVCDIYGAFLARPVPPGAPPFFGVVTQDDTLCCDLLLDTAKQWMQAGSPTEVHIYENGGHGYSIKPTGAAVDTWPDRLRDWLVRRDLLV